MQSRDPQELQPHGNSPLGHELGEEGLLVAAGTAKETQGMPGVNPKHSEHSRLGLWSHWCFPGVRVTPQLVGRGRDMQPAETGPCERTQSGARAAVDLRPNEQMTRLMG